MTVIDRFRGRFDVATARNRAAGKKCPDFEQMVEMVMDHVEPWIAGESGASLAKLAETLTDPLTPDTARDLAEREDAERWITDDAREFMAGQIERAGDVEIAFVLFRVSLTQFGDPVVSVRGGKSTTLHLPKDMVEPGCMLVHNHPSGDLTPSETDIKTLDSLIANVKVKFDFSDAIINNTGSRLFLLRDPRGGPGEPSRRRTRAAEEDDTDEADATAGTD